MDNVKSLSYPDITRFNIESDSEDIRSIHSDRIAKNNQNDEMKSLVSFNSELYGSELTDPTQEHVTVVFNWNYGGKDVFLVEYNDDGTENRRIRMIKSTNCFTTIQELPKKMFKYYFLVDDKFQYSPDDPCVKVDDYFINYIDITNFKSSDYTIPRCHEELIGGTFGNEMPGINYSSMEPPLFPDILNYRSPDINNINRAYSEIHILSNHIYKDTKKFLGKKYRSYMSLYRWANELTTVKLSSSIKAVTFVYVTFNENEDRDLVEEENEKLLNFFKFT